MKLVSWVVVAVCAGLLGAGCENNSDVKEGPSGGGAVLAVTPTTATLSQAAKTSVAFTATGGTGTYTWTVVNVTMGTISSSGAQAVYRTLTGTGQNIVIVTDDGGNSASAIVTQQ